MAVGGELGKDTAIVDNIPYFCPHLSLGDLVRVRRDGEVVRVLEHRTRTRHLLHTDLETHTMDQVQKRYAAVQRTWSPMTSGAKGFFQVLRCRFRGTLMTAN